MANYEEPSDRFTCDVFLSFRGEDTRYSFMGYLLDAFQKRGIKVFYDDKSLKIGEELSPAFYKAIEESNISVIVFSEDYASSKWCLNELAKIMECTKTNKKQIAFPIFYHVDPADVRHQRNSYEEAMIGHEKRFGKDSEKIKAWTAALSKVADLKGHHIHTGHEIDHVKEIAEKVHANIAPKPLLVGESPVGLDQHKEDAKSLLDLKPNDGTVCTLGIIGLGGIGKTELAKALYNKIVHQFEAASFLANVREKSNKINGLEDLQKTLLSEMFQQPKSELGSTSKGIYEIKHKLEKKKVLLVLDDVDEMKQLENLAGGSDWYGPGSRIIITTRDKGLLMGTHQIEVKTYEMTELNNQHSLQLFCRNAFGKNNPKTGYEAMSYRAIGYAKGLPLALKVIGCNLATRKSLKAWEDALKDYERIPRKGIQDVLKVSYDVLEPSAQSVFLDIACFFKGENIEYVEEVLVEFSATSNIEELVNKSLLNVDDGYLNMHDLIQDMGREIVRQEAPNNPAKRSRLWFHQDIIDVLSANDSGSDTIQGIMVGPSIYMTEVYWNDCAFEKMNCLRILIVRNITFSLKPKYLPNHLRLLHWEAYPSKTLPPKFYPRNIIIFNLPNSQLTLTEPFKQFSNLTVMNFSNNKYITTIPDVTKVENLRELRLDSCDNLTTVHESIGFLKHLVHLTASRCSKLENFLQRMFLPSLKVLDLDSCVKLEHFPDIVAEMNEPLEIHMRYTSIKKLPNSIGNLIGLVLIDMQRCCKLEYLPDSLFSLPNVVDFDFGGCPKLGGSFRRFLPDSPSEGNGRSKLKTMQFGESGLLDEDIETILSPKLERLFLSCNNLVSLPTCIKECNHLTFLDVRSCQKLEKIPECTNLRMLDVSGCPSLTHISELPCTIQQINANYCFNFSLETSDMLWDQVRKGRTELEHIMMPAVKVPKWFDYRCKGGFPVFWVRGKFPKIVLAFVFQDAVKQSPYPVNLFVELFPLINDKHVPNKTVCKFGIERNHVVVCDLQVLFCGTSIDALLLKNEWNQVHISYEVNDRTYELDKTEDYYLTVSEWGVFVDKQGIVNLEEHVQFTCPTTKDPIMTIDDFKHDDSNENPAVNENRVDKTIGIEDIPSPTAPEVDETEQYTHMLEENENSNDAAVNENENHYDKTIGTEYIPSPYPSGFFWRLLYTCFCKCFS
ncbi:TMV resistance protein N-like isoform X2 [Trifolium pratense]|uniref:TMV resistance protein N-like isoform X2 n=1 Tax=Trifolium pratense TaxID=57577 RepID=UPI001E695277|nr:TMV resistance protein N-like isoform X2 [Trifolium pratense]